MDPKQSHQYALDGKTGRWTLISTILASSMAFIDVTALNVILPSLQRDLGANGTDLFWVLNGYLLMLASLIIVGGSLGDRLGRVKVFKMGVLIFLIGSLSCGLAPSITTLIIFRLIQGLGGALMIPGSLSIISAVFTKKEKGKAIGTWSAATTIVTVCGPVLGGAFANAGLWRLIFFINIPLGVLALYGLHFQVPESRDKAHATVDWIGGIVLVFCLGLLTLGFLEMPELGYDHWLVVSSLAIGVLLLFGFIYVEKSVKYPMMPLSLFNNRTFSGVNLLSFFLYAALGAVILFLSLNVIQIQGYNQLQAGLTFLPFSVTMVLMSRKMGDLTDKFGPRRFLVLGPIVTGLGMLWLSEIGLTAGPADYWVTYFPGFLVFAIGMSITVVPLTTAVMSSVEDNKSGIASGINNSVTRISGTFMNAILGAVAIFMFADYVMIEAQTFIDSAHVLDLIREETVNLGEARSPESLDPEIKSRVDQLYKTGFIHTYRWVGQLSAGLAFLSAAFGFFMVEAKK